MRSQCYREESGASNQKPEALAWQRPSCSTGWPNMLSVPTDKKKKEAQRGGTTPEIRQVQLPPN